METFKVKVRVFLQQPSLGAAPEPDHEFELEVENAQDGLELLKFQISSLCVSEQWQLDSLCSVFAALRYNSV
jgi:hypothetical protein